MELLNSYLKAVRFYLPRGQRDDIAKELSDNILARVDDLEAELGRPLDEAEQWDVLRRIGDPMKVARCYRRDRPSLTIGWELIGPELFPAYAALLTLNLTIAIAFTAGIGLVLAAPLTVRMFVPPVLAQLICMTVLFAILNIFWRRFPQSWLFPPAALAPLQPVPRWSSMLGVVPWGIVSLWWLLIPFEPRLLFGTAAGSLKLAPAWQAFHVPILVLLLAGVAQRSVSLVRPRWTWLPPATRLAVNGLGLILQYFILASYPFVVVAGPSGDPARYRELAEVYNAVMLWGLFCWLWLLLLCNAIAHGWACVHHVRRWVRLGRLCGATELAYSTRR